MTTALIWLLQGIGCLWVVGGVFTIRLAWIERRLDTMVDDLERMAADLAERLDDGEAERSSVSENDAGRAWWLICGGVLTSLAGVGLMLGSWLALPPLGALILHQALYAIRQRARVRAAATEEEADEARMEPSTQRAAVFATAVAALAGSLAYTGDLSLWGILA